MSGVDIVLAPPRSGGELERRDGVDLDQFWDWHWGTMTIHTRSAVDLRGTEGEGWSTPPIWSRESGFYPGALGSGSIAQWHSYESVPTADEVDDVRDAEGLAVPESTQEWTALLAACARSLAPRAALAAHARDEAIESAVGRAELREAIDLITAGEGESVDLVPEDAGEGLIIDQGELVYWTHSERRISFREVARDESETSVVEEWARGVGR